MKLSIVGPTLLTAIRRLEARASRDRVLKAALGKALGQMQNEKM
jgi:hypothetical protein